MSEPSKAKRKELETRRRLGPRMPRVRAAVRQTAPPRQPRNGPTNLGGTFDGKDNNQ